MDGTPVSLKLRIGANFLFSYFLPVGMSVGYTKYEQNIYQASWRNLASYETPEMEVQGSHCPGLGKTQNFFVDTWQGSGGI